MQLAPQWIKMLYEVALLSLCAPVYFKINSFNFQSVVYSQVSIKRAARLTTYEYIHFLPSWSGAEIQSTVLVAQFKRTIN